MSQKEPIKAAIYARVSTDREEQKHSPEHQIAHCKEIAKENGWHVSDEFIYYDHGLSGTDLTQRIALQQLIKDGMAGKFQVVLFKSLSRFARNEADAYHVRDLLIESGLRMVADEDRYDSENGDDLKFGLFTMINAERSREISRSTRIGIRQSALKGNFTGNKAPFGYRKKGQKLEPDPDTKWIVKTIYELYTDKMYGLKKIAEALNEQGIPAYHGGAWGISSVRSILINPVYIGKIIANRYGTKGKGHKKKWFQKEEQDWVIVPSAHEAIIKPSVFEQAQQIRLRKNNYLSGKSLKRGTNVLLGLLHCAACGSSMVMTSSGRAAQTYRYLICSKRRSQGKSGCGNRIWLPYEPLIDALTGIFSTLFQQNVSLDELWTEIKESVSLDSSQLEKEKLAIERKIAKHRVYLLKLREQYFDSKLDEETFQYESSAMMKSIALHQSRLEQLDREIRFERDEPKVKSSVHEALQYFLGFKFNRPEWLRYIFEHLIESIVIDEHKQLRIKIKFYRKSIHTYYSHHECHAKT